MYGAHLQRGVAVYYGLYLRFSSALVERELLNHDGIESPRQPKQRERVSTLNRIQSERRLRNIELGQISCRHSLTFGSFTIWHKSDAIIYLYRKYRPVTYLHVPESSAVTSQLKNRYRSIRSRRCWQRNIFYCWARSGGNSSTTSIR